MYKPYIEKICKNLEVFWGLLSPEKTLKPNKCNFIYRGQRNSDWGLVPNVLRQGSNNPVKRMFGNIETGCRSQILAEFIILKEFVNQCDLLGLRIINDSVALRKNHLNTKNINPAKWPSEHLLEIMALAQHHGVPTRLLDWSKRSYVAAYFAASSALRNRSLWIDNECLAVWALDIECIGLYKNISIVNVPGATSKNLASQAGVLTLHSQTFKPGETFVPVATEFEFTRLPNTPLFKIAIPVTESKNILKLCELYGVTASTLFPGFDGASKAVHDLLNCWDKKDYGILKNLKRLKKG